MWNENAFFLKNIFLFLDTRGYKMPFFNERVTFLRGQMTFFCNENVLFDKKLMEVLLQKQGGKCLFFLNPKVLFLPRKCLFVLKCHFLDEKGPFFAAPKCPFSG